MYEDAELEALLMKDSSETHEEVAFTLGLTQETVSHPLKTLRMN